MSVRIDDPARLGESELPDGRLLGWAEWGPRMASPCFCARVRPRAGGWAWAPTLSPPSESGWCQWTAQGWVPRRLRPAGGLATLPMISAVLPHCAG
jgi:hypothetical protein